MDIFQNLTNSSERDIIVSLPKDKTWLEYLAYFIKLKANQQTLDIIVESVPKTCPGKKCYMIYDGLLRGYMIISNLTETEESEIVIELTPYLYSAAHKVKMNEIDGDGYKYYLDNSNEQ